MYPDSAFSFVKSRDGSTHLIKHYKDLQKSDKDCINRIGYRSLHMKKQQITVIATAAITTILVLLVTLPSR